MGKRIEKQGNILMIHLPKELDHHTAQEIREDADRFLGGGMVERIVFDFSETEFMDSSGIGMIMGRYRLLHLMGGKVSACHLKKQVQRIFQMSGLDSIVELVKE